MKKITLVRDPFEPASVSFHEAEDLREFLCGQFDRFPEGARIYQNEVATENDITPSDDLEIERLGELQGPFFVVLYPGDPLTAIAIITAVIAIALTAYTLLSIPNTLRLNNQNPVPSNSLSDRTNQARVKSRIPDIYGTVRAVPDLIQVPYRIFNTNSQELELSYMCISRGEIATDATKVFDGSTLVSAVNGESAEIYGPNTSPNSGSPQLTIGTAIGTGIISVQKANNVNGQTLFAPNYKRLGLECSDIYFQFQLPGPNGAINLDPATIYSFTKYFEVGDYIVLTTTSFGSGGGFISSLNGTYLVNAVLDKTLTLTSPGLINANWLLLDGYSGHKTAPIVGQVIDGYQVDHLTGLSGSKWVGPFILSDPNLTGLLNNFIALQGAYKTNGSSSVAFPITIEVGTTPVDAFGVATGGETLVSFTLPSSAVDTSQKAKTAISSISGRVSVRAHRTTLGDYTYAGTVTDTVQWRDLYGTSPVSQAHFGNVTTIQTVTLATAAALGLKERKINLLCTRKVPARIGSTSTFGATAVSDTADAIICAIALDPHIGNRTIAEIDVSNIYSTVAAIIAYFGIADAAQFGYTFDNDQLSFEETITQIAQTIFCTAYRQGQMLKLAFEQATPDSLILFNHRNKIPNSETRNVRFGNLDNSDGIEYTFVNSLDESVATFYIPLDMSATKAQTIQAVGVRSAKQAYLQAYRAYNKLLYQNTNVDFTATREADLVVRSNRVLIADNTRSDTQDGEILAQNVLVLALSQPFVYTSLNHVIALQLYDGTVQIITIAAADPSPARNITLAVPPTLALSLDDGQYARTVYQIVGNTDPRSSAFLIDTKTPQDRGTVQVTAINYDSRYYQNDHHYP